MKQKSGPEKAPAEQVVKDIRRQYSAEDPHRAGRPARGRKHLGALPPEGIAAAPVPKGGLPSRMTLRSRVQTRRF